MVSYTLLADATIALLAASIYAFTGSLLRRKSVGAENRLATVAFSIWWYALAGATVLGAVNSTAAAFGLQDLHLFVTTTMVSLLVICVALWGLIYYLLYLFTGNSRIVVPITVFYVVYYILLVYYVTASDPTGVRVETWRASLVYASPMEGPFFVAVLALLLLPQILGALAYFTLYFRVRDRTQRYRVALVSWSIIAWFTSSLLASIARLGMEDWWQITSRLIGLAAAVTILVAYLPPEWVRERYGIRSITGEDQSRRGPPASSAWGR